MNPKDADQLTLMYSLLERVVNELDDPSGWFWGEYAKEDNELLMSLRRDIMEQMGWDDEL